MKARRKPKHPL